MIPSETRALEGNGVRLRPARLPEDIELAIPWYSDPEVLNLSEGGRTEPYSRETIERMYSVLGGKGELYIIEVRDPKDGWLPIGDASLCPDSLPIVIGDPSYRSRGIGTQVLALLVERARSLGRRSLKVKGIRPENQRALRLFERAGFVRESEPCTDEIGNEMVCMEKRLTPRKAIG